MQPGLLGETELTAEVSRNQELLLVNIWNAGFGNLLHNHLVKQESTLVIPSWNSPLHTEFAAGQQGEALGLDGHTGDSVQRLELSHVTGLCS